MRIKPNQCALPSVPQEIWHDAYMAANESILLLDARLRIVASNRAALRMYEVRHASKLLGMNLRNLRAKAWRRELRQQFRDVERIGHGRWETRHVRQDGVEIDIEASVRRIRREKWRGYVYVANDITARKKAREATRMQAQMLDAIGEAVIATDPDGTIIYANRLARSLFGWAHTDPTGRSIMEVTVNIGDRASAERVMRLLRAGRIWKGEFQVRHQSGRTFPAEISNAPVFDKRGRLVAIIGVSKDISERKRASENLRLAEQAQRKLAEQLAEEKARLEAAQRVARVGSWETDLKTGAVSWSKETHRIFETDAATFRPTHRTFLRMVHPEDRLKVDRSFVESQNRRTTSVIEHRIRMPDGRIKHVEERWRTVFDRQGLPIRAVGTCQDITERKLRDLELRRSRESLANAQRVAGIGSWELDIPTGTLRWSDQIFRIFGISKRKFGASFEDFLRLVHPDDRKSVQAAQKATLSGKAKLDIEHRIVLPRDNSVRFVHELGELTRDKNGRPLRLSGTVHDITERKQKETELHASENQLHKLIGRLNTVRENEAKRIARELHDNLGQQLTAIALELASLRPALPEPSPEQQGQFDRIEAGVERAVETVQRISGELRLGQLDALGLSAAIDWQLQEFTRLTGIRRCRTTRLDEVNGLSDAQNTTLFRILQEALTNIARHSGATRVAVQLRAAPKSVTLKVRDDGRGISADEQRDRKSIGLLGMRERAEMVGGELTINGRKGRGTTVQVVIPRDRSARESQ